MDTDLFQVVKHLITKYNENETFIEVEARIKKILLTEDSTNILLKTLPDWNTETYTEKKTFYLAKRKCILRERIYISPHKDPEIISKSTLLKSDYNNNWCSIFVNLEKPAINLLTHLEHINETITITRHRTKINNYYIDIIQSPTDYRVEIEVLNIHLFVIKEMLDVVDHVCHILQDSPEYINYYDYVMVMHIVNYEYEKFCISQKKYQKPMTMKYSNLNTLKTNLNDWLVTPKIDGIRKFIIIINKKIFECTISLQIKFIGTCDIEDLVILDSEFYNDIYYIFDIPFSQEITVFRKDILNDYETLLPSFQIKPYKSFKSFDDLANLYNDFNNNYYLDGLVFIHKNKQYLTDQIYKWKKYSTVDLQVLDIQFLSSDNKIIQNISIERPNEGGIWEFTHVDSKLIPVQKTEKAHDEKYIQSNYMNNPVNINVTDIQLLSSDKQTLKYPWEKPENLKGIWEFQYKDGTLIPVRYRKDKLTANSLEIVSLTLHSALSGDIFTGKGCFLMRKYHNIEKSNILHKYLHKNNILLDIGTGQGGDIKKWKKASHIYCIEPNITELTERYDLTEFLNIQLFPICLRDFNISNITKKINVITAFFCANLFKTDDWDVLKTIIKKKTTIDCKVILILLMYPTDCTNKLFTIRTTDNKYNISIHNTRIINIDESVVTLDFLNKFMKDCNMEHEKSYQLMEDDFMTKEERQLSSKYKMFVYKKKLNYF